MGAGTTTLRRALRTPWGRAGLVAVVVALLTALAVAVAGGFRTLEAGELPEHAVGEPVDLGPVTVTVLDAVVTDEARTSRLENVDGAAAWLVVRARVEVTGEETRDSLPTTVVPPPGVVLTSGAATPGAPSDGRPVQPDQQVLLRDGTSLPQGHPGLPEEVAYLWAVADPSDVPDPLDLTLLGSTPYYSPIYRRDTWTSPEPVGQVVVPLKGRVPEILVEEQW